MMLRESIERDGAEADLRAITNDAAAAGSRIPGAEALVAFANAALGDDEGAITEAPKHAVRTKRPLQLRLRAGPRGCLQTCAHASSAAH